MTAEKFIPNPFSNIPGARLYRTGDLARYRSDGTIEFHGRIDHQVKLRGFRIELGEIEAALRRHSAVREAVVICREDNPGEKRLVAYVVAAGEPLSSGDLRRHLKQTLPEYMVPAAFVVVEALPLTPNGKVDRRALPAPEGTRTHLETNYVAPQTPTEQTLGAIWQEVLGVELVGVHDNFFDLGGHSLLATQVVSRVRETLHIDLPLRLFFDLPSIKGLAGTLEILHGSTQSPQCFTKATKEKRSEIRL